MIESVIQLTEEVEAQCKTVWQDATVQPEGSPFGLSGSPNLLAIE